MLRADLTGYRTLPRLVMRRARHGGRDIRGFCVKNGNAFRRKILASLLLHRAARTRGTNRRPRLWGLVRATAASDDPPSFATAHCAHGRVQRQVFTLLHRRRLGSRRTRRSGGGGASADATRNVAVPSASAAAAAAAPAVSAAPAAQLLLAATPPPAVAPVQPSLRIVGLLRTTGARRPTGRSLLVRGGVRRRRRGPATVPPPVSAAAAAAAPPRRAATAAAPPPVAERRRRRVIGRRVDGGRRQRRRSAPPTAPALLRGTAATPALRPAALACRLPPSFVAVAERCRSRRRRRRPRLRRRLGSVLRKPALRLGELLAPASICRLRRRRGSRVCSGALSGRLDDATLRRGCGGGRCGGLGVAHGGAEIFPIPVPLPLPFPLTLALTFPLMFAVPFAFAFALAFALLLAFFASVAPHAVRPRPLLRLQFLPLLLQRLPLRSQLSVLCRRRRRPCSRPPRHRRCLHLLRANVLNPLRTHHGNRRLRRRVHPSRLLRLPPRRRQRRSRGPRACCVRRVRRRRVRRHLRRRTVARVAARQRRSAQNPRVFCGRRRRRVASGRLRSGSVDDRHRLLPRRRHARRLRRRRHRRPRFAVASLLAVAASDLLLQLVELRLHVLHLLEARRGERRGRRVGCPSAAAALLLLLRRRRRRRRQPLPLRLRRGALRTLALQLQDVFVEALQLCVHAVQLQEGTGRQGGGRLRRGRPSSRRRRRRRRR
eukprot:Rhum_TRINITY_DN10454_c0_g1::Rhum_TRINITY_DN10454_c0_g1_i1::g.38523::m.38523